MEIRRDVFQAIADPTRRQIIDMIAGEPLNLNTIAGNFTITRQAISLHIKILTECGLIHVKQIGRERYCEAKLEKLNEVDIWIEQYRLFWTQKLAALKIFLEQENSQINKHISKKRKSTSLKKSTKK